MHITFSFQTQFSEISVNWSELQQMDVSNLMMALDIPMRELLVQASVCRSIADLTQRNIYFYQEQHFYQKICTADSHI